MTVSSEPTVSPEPTGPAASAATSLAAIADEQGALAIVAMDQRNTLRRMYAAAGIENPSDDELVGIKADVVAALRGSASAFLLDPTFGVPALQQVSKTGPAFGVLVAAEPAERGSVGSEPRTHRDPSLDAAWVRNQGGHAVKFLVQLRADRAAAPGEPDTTAETLQVIREVVEDCRRAGIPSVIENLIFPLNGEQPATETQRTDRIIHAAELIDELQPDLIKLEYPGSEAACARLAERIRSPWAVLSAGVPFEQFTDVVRVSCDAGGASGFIAGRSIWKDAVGLDPQQRKAFLNDEGRRRLDALVEVIAGRVRPVTHLQGATP